MTDPNVFALDIDRLRPEQVPLVAGMSLEHAVGAVQHHRSFNEMAGQYAKAVASHLPPENEGLTVQKANELKVAIVNLANLLDAYNQIVEEGFMKFASELSIAVAETGETKQ
ncbi:hypothetical protein [Rhodoplanes azumiensis]|uniref:Uncharacterized protein n=1 Tax=Rhodoplanes azumiensis TaxID=1897628 RepID=A0ABW5AKV9_9BRAD